MLCCTVANIPLTPERRQKMAGLSPRTASRCPYAVTRCVTVRVIQRAQISSSRRSVCRMDFCISDHCMTSEHQKMLIARLRRAASGCQSWRRNRPWKRRTIAPATIPPLPCLLTSICAQYPTSEHQRTLIAQSRCAASGCLQIVLIRIMCVEHDTVPQGTTKSQRMATSGVLVMDG